MSLLRKEKIRNGCNMVNHYVYKCDRCGKEMPEECGGYLSSNPDEHYCHECAFILGIIDGIEYGRHFGCLDYRYAEVNPITMKIEFVKVTFYKTGKKKGQIKSRGKFTWEMLPSQFRGCRYYRLMRNEVLKRDNYTCQDCGAKAKDITLNIHHIKPFAEFPDYRLDEDNCVTLCVECHKQRHKEGNLNGQVD